MRSFVPLGAVVVTTLSLFSTPIVAEPIPSRSDQHSSRYAYDTPLLITGVGASAWALASNGIGSDKKKHFALSALFGAGSETLLRSYSYTASHRLIRLTSATVLGTLPGVAKELSDSKFDNNDILADIIGAFTGAFLSDLLQGPTEEQEKKQSLYITADSEKLTVSWSMAF